HCELYNGLILLLGHWELRNDLTSLSDIERNSSLNEINNLSTKQIVGLLTFRTTVGRRSRMVHPSLPRTGRVEAVLGESSTGLGVPAGSPSKEHNSKAGEL
ncbi:hypothetical protein Tco_0261413, partial [Tanacetum coccineum]